MVEQIKEYILKNKILIGVIVLLIIINVASIIILENKKPIYNDNVLSVDCKEKNTVEKFFVDVKGEVNNPGVYEINKGSIVNDVINLAGGFTDNSYISNINLSQKVEDETVIYIYKKSEFKNKISNSYSKYNITNNINKKESIIPKENISITRDNTLLININTSSATELQKIPGIGEVISKRIIDYRNKNGLFQKIDDLKKVSGIGDKTFDKIKKYITV